MITSLKIRQFRNHEKLDLDFNHNLVIITGQNAIGKTNILESIYVSSITKSFRVSDVKLISHGKDFYTIDKDQDGKQVHIRLTTNNNSRQKQIRVNKSPVTISSFIGMFPVTLFEPNDLYLFAEGPSKRRNFLDKIISQTDAQYLQSLRKYKRIVAQRNSALKNSKKNYNKNIKQQIFVYNIQLIEPAEYITKKRDEFVKDINGIVNKYYQDISGEDKNIQIDFSASAKNKEELLKKLENNEALDMITTHTSVGPHREDFTVTLNKENILDTASRGEIRSLILALKLAELDYIENALSRRPTLLLDDVLSELDTYRQKYLLKQLGRQQTFVTTTHLPSKIGYEFQHIELPL